MFESPPRIKDSGWIRSNHRVEIEKVAEDEVYYWLTCPPCCPSVANNHTDDWDYLKSPELGYTEPYQPDAPTWQCMVMYEHVNCGLMDGWQETAIYGETLDEASIEHLKSLPPGDYDFEIEFGAEYGWTESTWVGPSEYEWRFYWRIIHD